MGGEWCLTFKGGKEEIKLQLNSVLLQKNKIKVIPERPNLPCFVIAPGSLSRRAQRLRLRNEV